MSDFNSLNNRVVWFDIPVADLNRAQAFYRAVLGVEVERVDLGGSSFCVLAHDQGNGGCLIVEPAAIGRTGGVLIYMNVEGRIATRSRRLKPTVAESSRPCARSGSTAFARSCRTAKATGLHCTRPPRRRPAGSSSRRAGAMS